MDEKSAQPFLNKEIAVNSLYMSTRISDLNDEVMHVNGRLSHASISEAAGTTHRIP